ncbi:GGDEF domain-containing protein [Kineococcus auxinigenes]|uniref:GGDEF domain-containing protein n=1 Tax=unclassified Kineococcus TaxID=2621656 RepID=UPI003D7D09DC
MKLPVRIHCVLAPLVIVLCLLLPEGLPRAVLNTLIGFACAGLVVLGVHRNRPRGAAAWWLIAAGVGAWTLGDALYSYLELVLGISPFPSVADVSYLAAYPLLTAALWSFVRSRTGGRDREGVIDTAIISIGFALLSWIFLMQPTLADGSATVPTRVLAALYPVGDVLLLALLVRLFTSSGARSASFRLLGAGVVLMLVADSVYQVQSLDGVYSPVLDAGWLASYACIAAAALHPSMRRLTELEPSAGVAFGRGRLLALMFASLLSPGTMVLQLCLGLSLEPWAVALSSVVLFVLVVVRMSGLLARVQEQSAQLAALARTDALTGLPNRRSGDAELHRLQQEAVAEGRPLAVAVLDLDRFKSFNDTFGHPAGDRLLSQAALAWTAGLDGTGAVLARWGGEEFLVVLPDRDLAGAAAVVDALRARTPLGQTFSAGVAQWDRTETLAALVARTDEALYEAKHAGRDRVVTAGAVPAAQQPVPPRPSQQQPSPRAAAEPPAQPVA